MRAMLHVWLISLDRECVWVRTGSLRFDNVSFISYSTRNNARALIESIEFDQTKPLKTPRIIVGIWPENYSRLGKMRFLDMKMVRTRENDGIFGILTSKSSKSTKTLTFFNLSRLSALKWR